MLSIVQQACIFNDDRSGGVIVVASDIKGPPFNAAFDELNATDAKRLAQNYASSQGVAPASINGMITNPYAVNEDGVPLEDVKDQHNRPLPPTHPKMKVAGYCIAVPVVKPLR